MREGAKIWVLGFGLNLPNLHFFTGLILVYETQNLPNFIFC